MSELKMEHVLMLIIVVFVLYHFMGRCSCRNGFRVGAVARPKFARNFPVKYRPQPVKSSGLIKSSGAGSYG